MQESKEAFGTRLQFPERLALNAGKYTANQPTRLAHHDDGNDRAKAMRDLLKSSVQAACTIRSWRSPNVFWHDSGRKADTTEK
jgi:hypothetical protein